MKLHNTTPYGNCSTDRLYQQLEEINESITAINAVPCDHLNFLDFYRIEKMLIELKTCILRELENRRIKRLILDALEETH